jgi:hypothetical protein
MGRREDLNRLYALLAELDTRVGGARLLRTCAGRMTWPLRGVYFFFEDGELREDDRTPRVVRVGTHAVSAGSRTTLWNRLSQHRGFARSGGGNHRGSIFRLHVGMAMLREQPEAFVSAQATWGRGSSADRTSRVSEEWLEKAVSRYIGEMPFLWVEVDDAPGATSRRQFVEANLIALLSNANKPPIDPPSSTWLGHHSDRVAIRESGLWNVNHVNATYTPEVLDMLEFHIRRAPPASN